MVCTRAQQHKEAEQPPAQGKDPSTHAVDEIPTLQVTRMVSRARRLREEQESTSISSAIKQFRNKRCLLSEYNGTFNGKKVKYDQSSITYTNGHQSGDTFTVKDDECQVISFPTTYDSSVAQSMTQQTVSGDQDDVVSSQVVHLNSVKTRSAYRNLDALLCSQKSSQSNWTEARPGDVLGERKSSSENQHQVQRGGSCQPSESSQCSDQEQQVSVPLAAVSHPEESENNQRVATGEQFVCSQEQLLRSQSLLAGNSQEEPISRSKEVNALSNFLKEKIDAQKGGVVYCQGQPGTGKTHTVTYVVETMQSHGGVDTLEPVIVKVNCIAFSSPKIALSEIYTKINQQLNIVSGQSQPKQNNKSKKTTSSPSQWRHLEDISAIRELVSSKSQTRPSRQSKAQELHASSNSSKPLIILILDEIDSLELQNKQIVFSLFRLANEPDSKLVIVALSNTMSAAYDDMVARKQIVQLTFEAYTSNQIQCILQNRLAPLPFQVISQPAIRLCAQQTSRKGDIREALEACKMSLGLLRTYSGQNTTRNQHASQQSTQQSVSTEDQPIVSPAIMNKVLQSKTSIFTPNSAQGVKGSIVQNLSINQKLILCVIAVMCQNRVGSVKTPKAAAKTTKKCPAPLSLSSLSLTPTNTKRNTGMSSLTEPQRSRQSSIKSSIQCKPPLHPNVRTLSSKKPNVRAMVQTANLNHVYYKFNACLQQRNWDQMNWTQVHDLCGTLQCSGLIDIKRAKNGFQEISIEVGIRELKHSLNDIHTLKSFLEQLK